MKDQMYDAAASEFEAALAVEPAEPVMRYHYAVCLFGAGRNDEARRQFETLAKQAGRSPEVVYYLGRLDLLENKPVQAIHEFTSQEGNGKIADLPYYLGLAYVAASDPASAVKWLEKAASSTPRDYHVHYRLARLYSSLGRNPEADREYKLYQECRDAQKDTEVHARACNQALGESHAASATDACRPLFDPNDPEKLVLLGQLFGQHGAYAEAIEPLRRATQVDANSFDAWHNLGLSYFRLQRYKEAREPLERAAALRPDFFDTLNVLGATLYMLGDDQAALPVMEQAHKLRPDDSQLAQALRQLKQAMPRP
jgi:Flp pilus assembly protein TadD